MAAAYFLNHGASEKIGSSTIEIFNPSDLINEARFCHVADGKQFEFYFHLLIIHPILKPEFVNVSFN